MRYIIQFFFRQYILQLKKKTNNKKMTIHLLFIFVDFLVTLDIRKILRHLIQPYRSESFFDRNGLPLFSIYIYTLYPV